jgi:hypothetical protein
MNTTQPPTNSDRERMARIREMLMQIRSPWHMRIITVAVYGLMIVDRLWKAFDWLTGNTHRAML